MDRPGYLPEPPGLLVGDTSVWINLVASGCIEEIIAALGAPFAIARSAMIELERGAAAGWPAGMQVAALVARGAVTVRDLSTDDEALFLSLVQGFAVETLDDGEAATLAVAVGARASALIDEKKATGIAVRRFPSLRVTSTTDLLLDPKVMGELGERLVAEALFNALRVARMRVPPHRIDQVIGLIGGKRADQCPSLPGACRSIAHEITA